MSGIDTINLDFSSQYINWQPDGDLTTEQKEKIKSGDFGTVENFATLQDGSLQIKTQYGTLVLSGPELDDVKKDLSIGDFITTGSRLDNISTPDYMTDLYAVLKLLHETNVERRQADREARHASRDAAMSESLNAAQEIRNGAICALVFGCVSGAINIGMGLISAGGALKSLGAMKTPIQEFKTAQANLKTSETNLQFKQQQFELAQARNEVKLNQEVVTTKQTALTKADSDVVSAQKNFDDKTAEIQAKQKEIDKLTDPLGGNLINKEDAPKLEQAQKDLKILQDEQTGLKTKLDTAKETQLTAKTDLEKANQTLEASKTKVAELETKVTETNKKLKNPEDDPTREISIEDAKKDVTAAQTEYVKAQQECKLAGENLNNKFQELSTKGTFYQSIGQVGSGLANIMNSVGQMLEQMYQAESKEHDAQATKIQAQGEDITQEMQNEMETINDVKDFFKSMLQSNNQAFQSMLQI